MAISVIADAEEYLYRYPSCTTTIDPLDLIRDLVGECKQLKTELTKIKTKKPPASPK